MHWSWRGVLVFVLVVGAVLYVWDDPTGAAAGVRQLFDLGKDAAAAVVTFIRSLMG
jgi:hypothetical protein